MLYPAMSTLLKNVDSRYLLVNVIARRARQISIESEITHEPLTDKPVTIAIREVADGKLTAKQGQIRALRKYGSCKAQASSCLRLESFSEGGVS